jgi:hypothetical protein
LLVNSSMFFPHVDVLSIVISSTWNIHDLSSFIDKVWCLPSEKLEPSWVSWFSHEVVSTHWQRQMLPLVGFDCLWLFIEVELHS